MIEIPKTKRVSEPFESKGFPVVLIASVIFLILPVCFYLLLYREPLATLGQISTAAIAEQERLAQERAQGLIQLQALQTQYESLDRNAVEKISDAIPDSKELPELIQNINQVAKSVNVHVDSLNVSDSKPSGKEGGGASAKSVSIQLDVSSISYETLKELVAKLLQNSRFLSFSSLRYNPKEQSASFMLSAHYLSK